MPIPIQIGSITDRLRKFLRIRGRVRLSLDETVVPTVQVQDLTAGPYQAGVQPAAASSAQNFTIGRQMVIYLNPDAGLVPAADLTTDTRFLGRSFTLESLMFISDAVAEIRVGLVPRGSLLAATITAVKSLIRVQDGNGIATVPVQMGVIPAIPFVIFPAVQEFWSGQFLLREPLNVNAAPPPTTIRSSEVIVIEAIINSGNMDVNVRGTWQEQPS